ncbi:MAG: S9 family peptidase [Deltaproteobacteria bacterium]|nr:S9 family peptidase [Deltaproteobacteria bacterium]
MKHTIRLALLGLATLLAACNGRDAGAVEPQPQPEPTLDPELAAVDAAARAGAVVETIFGREVADPFRALENDDEATRHWMEVQTAFTESYLAEHADPTTAERLEAYLSIGYFGDATRAGGRTFYTKRDGDQEQGALYVLEPDAAAPRTLVDPNALGPRTALDWVFPSPGGRYVAYGLSEAGDERSVLHVLRVEDGTILDERIDHTKWTSLSWLADETGFYYTRYPREGETDWDAENVDSYFAHLFFHALGTDPAQDPPVFRLAEKTDFVGPDVSPDDRWVVLNVFHGWSQSDVLLLDRNAAGAEPLAVDVGGEHLVSGEVQGDRLYLGTNEDHPRFRIVAAPLDRPADRTAWVEVIPEGEGTIEGWSFVGEALAVRTTENVESRLRLFALDGTPRGEVELPMRGSVDGPAENRGDDLVVFEFDSFTQPPTLYAFDPATGLRELDRVGRDFDPSRYELRRETVASKDGTPIVVYLVLPAGLAADGARPTLVTGYGGFNVPMLPGFVRNILYWLERGGVYVQAALRGGSEFGEEWHRAGMLENKHNVFDDMEAVLRWLPTTGLTSPEHIAITGASNGGLLMGAMITRCPDAFRAAAASVGLYDMVRFAQFPPAEIWMSEYGDPSEPEAFAWLLDYSPYHAVRDGTPYPAVLVSTADRDTRVSWKHSTKFAARLQEASSSDRPILFHLERSVGHGAGTGRSDTVREYVRKYTFFETELGPLNPGASPDVEHP